MIDCFMPHVHILASICRVKMPMPSPVPLERVCELGTTDTLLHIPYGISWGCSSWNRHTHARVRAHKHTHTHTHTHTKGGSVGRSISAMIMTDFIRKFVLAKMVFINAFVYWLRVSGWWYFRNFCYDYDTI